MLAQAAGAPLVFWFLGGADPSLPSFKEWAESGRMPEDIPSNHSPHFAPTIQPTLSLGTEALVTAAREYLAK
jgi:hippurate hydrolase